MSERAAPAKINLALVVGPAGAGGKHEVTTVLQRIGLADRVSLEASARLRVEGYTGDTLVAAALEGIAEAAGTHPGWAAHITKEIPVAAGLAGGSSDAAAALLLANATLDTPLEVDRLHELAAGLGADIPFFLTAGPQLGEGDGSTLTPLELPFHYSVLIHLADDAGKPSTAAVYAAFDARDGARAYEQRRARLLEALAAGDLAALPPNDLASSPVADELRALGALRADVTGAGPAVYALFDDPAAAATAKERLQRRGRVWIVPPSW
jgi:4-diphosphocytidyl-2-C-methyl-D-erythritol kinase